MQEWECPIHCVRTFIGGEGRQQLQGGNRHLIFRLGKEHLVAEKNITEWIRQYSAHNTRDICIALWIKEAGATYYLRAIFCQYGRYILRCGSGNIAIAAAVYRVAPQVFRSSIVGLETPVESLVLVKKSATEFGYRAYPCPLRPFSCSRLWQRITGIPLVGGAFSGGPRDYVIVETQHHAFVRDMVPLLRRLCTYSARALIVTAPFVDTPLFTSTRHSMQYVMRYFAPQYGVNEDAATGSANIQLMHYWHKRGGYGGGSSVMLAHQLSKEGAVMEGVCSRSLITLFGRVNFEQ